MAKSEKNDQKTAKSSSASVSSPSGSPRINLDIVRELARIAGEFNLAEVEVDPSGHVRVRRETAAFAEERGSSRPSPIALAPPAPVAEVPQDGTFISSPFVGTFYRAPSPDAPSFAEVGQNVRKGQVVCIVEAMKLMNEIEAESDGRVMEFLVQNGEHVEYGQHLVRLGKS